MSCRSFTHRWHGQCTAVQLPHPRLSVNAQQPATTMKPARSAHVRGTEYTFPEARFRLAGAIVRRARHRFRAGRCVFMSLACAAMRRPLPVPETVCMQYSCFATWHALTAHFGPSWGLRAVDLPRDLAGGETSTTQLIPKPSTCRNLRARCEHGCPAVSPGGAGKHGSWWRWGTHSGDVVS